MNVVSGLRSTIVRSCAAAVGAMIGIASVSSSAQAQQGVWLPGQQWPGFDSEIVALCTWDPDGSGPAGEVIVSSSGSNSAPLQFFDGDSWRSEPNGLVTAGNIVPTVCDGTLYVSGYVRLQGSSGSYIGDGFAKFDGTQWVDARNGLQGTITGPIKFRGDLIAAYYIQVVGGESIAGVVRWDGSAWQEFGTMRGFGSRVTVLGEYNGDLIAGGAFSTVNGVQMWRIARWDGTQWHPLSLGLNGVPTSLAEFEGDLIVGGSHSTAGGEPNPRVSRWNGTAWSAFSTNLAVGPVTSIRVFQDRLYVSGPTTLDGRSVNMIAWWDESLPGWRRVGSGVTSGDRVNTMVILQNKLYMAGYFGSVANLNTRNIARWTGTEWEATGQGLNGSVSSFTEWNGQLVAVGSFTIGSETLNGVGRWDGLRWWKFGSGFTGVSGEVVDVRTACVHEQQLVVAGKFRFDSQDSPRGVAVWNGASWNAPAGGLADDSGDRVEKVVSFNGKLIAGGRFTSSAGSFPNYLAQFEAGLWQPVGGSIPDGIVDDMDVFQNKVLVCGTFQNIGGTPAANLAEWDGTSWQAFPKPSGMSVKRLSVVDGLLHAVVQKDTGDYAVLQWTGTDWLAVDSPFGQTALEDVWRYRGSIVTGTATQAAMWDGESWQVMPGSWGGFRSFFTFSGELLFAIQSRLEENNIVAGWMRWVSSSGAWLLSQPQAVRVKVGQTLFVRGRVASGYAAASKRWHRNGVPVVDGDAGAAEFGGVASGSDSTYLTIVNAQRADSGQYQLQLDFLGSATQSASVQIDVVCSADLDDGTGGGQFDGSVDINDLLFFLTAFESGNMAADLDNGQGSGVANQSVDISDLLYFLSHFAEGC